MTPQDLFWTLFELGVLLSRCSAARAVELRAKLQSPSFTVFLPGSTYTSADRLEVAKLAMEFVDYATGAPAQGRVATILGNLA